jgi:hypothetical protein
MEKLLEKMSEAYKLTQFFQKMAIVEDSKFEGELLKFLDLFCTLMDIKIDSKEKEDDFYIFYLDMSSIQMRVSDTTPFFVTRINTGNRHHINNRFLKVKNKIYEDKLQDQVAFIIVTGQTDFFKILCKDSLLDLVVLDKNSLKQVSNEQKPRSALIKICKQQVSIQRLSPYEIVDPVVGRMFYGRKWEMQQLVNKADTNFVITGCRKIGKSSLLLNAYQMMRQEAATYPEFFDCYPYKKTEDFINEVVSRMEIKQLRRMRQEKFHHFLRRTRLKLKKRITFIMDEVDNLLESDKNNGWELFNILSAAQAEGYCRIIITGYRTVFEEILNLYSPIFKNLEFIRIHDLDHRSAVSLITQPIRDMGILFAETDKIIERILTQTSRQPNLIQFMCKKLIEIVEKRNANEITFEDILEVEKSAEYRNYISDTFIWNAIPIEKLVSFCMLDCDQFTFKEIDMEMEKRGISLEENDLQRICAILEMANVFRKVEGKYQFSNPVLPQILKKDYDPGHMIEKLSKEVKSRWKTIPKAQ